MPVYVSAMPVNASIANLFSIAIASTQFCFSTRLASDPINI